MQFFPKIGVVGNTKKREDLEGEMKKMTEKSKVVLEVFSDYV